MVIIKYINSSNVLFYKFFQLSIVMNFYSDLLHLKNQEEQFDRNNELRLVWVFPISLKNEHDRILIPTEFLEFREKIQKKKQKN